MAPDQRTWKYFILTVNRAGLNSNGNSNGELLEEEEESPNNSEKSIVIIVKEFI